MFQLLDLWFSKYALMKVSKLFECKATYSLEQLNPNKRRIERVQRIEKIFSSQEYFLMFVRSLFVVHSG